MKQAAKKQHALDIFDVLKQLSQKKYDLWDNLSEEERKSIAPSVIMRWLAGTDDISQIYVLNAVCNPFAFALGNHKELMLKLFASATSGNVKRYNWMPMKNDKKAPKKTLELIAEFHGFSQRQARDVAHLFSAEDLKEMAEQLGWQKDEIKELKC
jgi:hypothetical protein